MGAVYRGGRDDRVGAAPGSRSMKRVFRLPGSRRRIDAELASEFQFHLQERVEQFVASGMTRAEAEAEAQRRFGDFEAYRRLAQQIDEETMRQRSFREFIGTIV